jgi:ABC-type multidrug transport system ATPase subunit
MSPNNVALRADGVTRRYGAVSALDGVTVEVRAGEVLGLVGPNGAGKTTLFECIAGVQPCDAGSIDAGAGVFYMPDGIMPWDTQQVGWVVHFFAALHGCSRESAQAVCAALDIDTLRDQRILELSRGQRKRVLIALTLLTPHAVALLDEPFEGLDLRLTRQVAGLLRAQRHRALFLSIHQLADAERVCDRMVLLSAGHVVGVGTPAELRALAELPDASLEDVFLALT